MDSYGSLIAAAALALRQAGIEQPQREARLLLAHALGVAPAAIMGWPERAVADPRLFADYLARRLAQEPIARILGKREFWSLSFALNDQTLDPRPDTETLIDGVLAAEARNPPPDRVLDLGTGSGCILLSLLSEWPQALGIGLDRSPGAAAQARRNAQDLGLGARAVFLVSDWDAAFAPAPRFDVAVSNPPYIPSAALADLPADVRCYDPRAALDGGADGLDCYRLVLPAMMRSLRPGGLAAVEFGQGQDRDIAALAVSSGLNLLEIRNDLAGIPRVLLGRRPEM